MATVLKNYQEEKKHSEKLKGTIYIQTRRIDEQSKVIAKQRRVIEKIEKELQDLIEATNKTELFYEKTITEKVQTITEKDQNINMLKEQLKMILSGQEQDILIRVMLDFEAQMVEKYEKELSEIVSREEQFKRESKKHNIKVLNDNKEYEKNMSALCRENNRSIAIKNQNVSDKKELNAQQDMISSMIKNFEEDMKRQLTYIDWKSEEISRKNESLTKKRKEFTMEKEEHAKTRATHAKEIEIIIMEKEEHAKEIETITMEIEELTREKDRINRKIEELEETFTTKVIKPEFMCPITMELMTDPVITSDGYTYERSSITTWFNKSNTSPMTGLDIPNTLIPNIVLRKLIGDTRE